LGLRVDRLADFAANALNFVSRGVEITNPAQLQGKALQHQVKNDHQHHHQQCQGNVQWPRLQCG